MLSLIDLQEYSRFKARQHHEVIASPPFTLFLRSSDSSEDSNYAIPDVLGNSDLSDSLMRLQTVFTAHDRRPRLQFIEEAFPPLAPALSTAGWLRIEQSPVMICTPETYQPAPTIRGLTITTLSHESAVHTICESLDTNSLGFDPQAQQATLQDAEQFRQELIHSRAFTAYLDEQPVSAGMFTDIHEGLTELVGITTLEPFRRRGIASALTAYMTHIAFSQGATLVFLSAANEQAGRIYERVGFRPYATRVVYKVSGEDQ